jgi:DNA-directed RNA polymerase alpha subunit
MESQINIKELYNNIDDFDSSKLKLEFSGNDINYAIINAIRKVCIDQIPIYAFHSSKINILRNSSVFDNSYMKERLGQLPIKNINHNIKFLPLKYYKDVNFADNKFIKHIDDVWDIDFYLKSLLNI